MTVLSLTPSTRGLANTLKVTATAALALTSATSLAVAVRDNGPKEAATTIFLVGDGSPVGTVLTARNSKNNAAYGPITVKEVLTAETAATSTLKAALFVVAGTIEPKAPKAPRAPKAPKVVAPALVTVVKAKDGTVVAQNLSVLEANDLIAKAKASKKATLRIAA
jgi:hypothetical protein